MSNVAERNEKHGTAGLIPHAAAGYDFLVWLATSGGSATSGRGCSALARLEPGEAVLASAADGTLAIAARRRVGPSGEVCALDASPEMIARARKKARRAGVDVSFENAFAQSLPYPDARFDAVLTTIMLHHLPKAARQELAREIRRVLKPGGRVLAIDFAGPGPDRKKLLDYVHRRHGHVTLEEIVALLGEAGLKVVESGAVGMRDLGFVVATAPCCA